MGSVSLVLPVFNEVRGIVHVVDEVVLALASLDAPWEVVLVDDGSTDGSAERLDECARSHPHVRVLRFERNRGYGAAVRAGFEASRMDVVGFMDSDGQFEPHDVLELLARVADADVVVGLRERRADGRARWALSRAYNFAVGRVLRIAVADVNCGLKLIRRDALARLSLESTGYAFSAELLAQAAMTGLRVHEVEVAHRSRHAGRSKVNVRGVAQSIREVLSLRARVGPR